ncbi:hypothetical protein F2Q69_00022403 [Brassica cretica]|uniref:Uncharacterized protein n=1 Tax=Brassica cretica TaxID=69181 RepID=A0A8S9Q8U2_BRACR|nr:hypothetical protein F2Q69_00022403 [Brassica cretica]
MDDEWWNDCIHVIFEHHSPLDRLGRHISTDDGYYPGSRLDQNIESETVTENNYDNVNQEDDSDAPSRNQNDSPSSYNHRSKQEAFYRILDDDEAEDGSINFGESFIDPYSFIFLDLVQMSSHSSKVTIQQNGAIDRTHVPVTIA